MILSAHFNESLDEQSFITVSPFIVAFTMMNSPSRRRRYLSSQPRASAPRARRTGTLRDGIPAVTHDEPWQTLCIGKEK